jgi:diaminohydroxyphosphoribosylaminopyrimidine deaminase/5-amino-6-(5-phosphoribosylamino)uracil reductase
VVADEDGRVAPTALLTTLFAGELPVVLLEGGPTLAAAFLRDQLVDRVIGYYAPAILGAGHPLVGDIGVPTIASAVRLDLVDVTAVGGDVRIEARPRTELTTTQQED